MISEIILKWYANSNLCSIAFITWYDGRGLLVFVFLFDDSYVHVFNLMVQMFWFICRELDSDDEEDSDPRPRGSRLPEWMYHQFPGQSPGYAGFKERQAAKQREMMTKRYERYVTLFFDFRCLINFAKNINLSWMVSLWCALLCKFSIYTFKSDQWVTILWAKFDLECLLLIFIYSN